MHKHTTGDIHIAGSADVPFLRTAKQTAGDVRVTVDGVAICTGHLDIVYIDRAPSSSLNGRRACNCAVNIPDHCLRFGLIVKIQLGAFLNIQGDTVFIGKCIPVQVQTNIRIDIDSICQRDILQHDDRHSAVFIARYYLSQVKTARLDRRDGIIQRLEVQDRFVIVILFIGEVCDIGNIVFRQFTHSELPNSIRLIDSILADNGGHTRRSILFGDRLVKRTAGDGQRTAVSAAVNFGIRRKLRVGDHLDGVAPAKVEYTTSAIMVRTTRRTGVEIRNCLLVVGAAHVNRGIGDIDSNVLILKYDHAILIPYTAIDVRRTQHAASHIDHGAAGACRRVFILEIQHSPAL